MTSAATAYADAIQINGSYTIGYSKSTLTQNAPGFSWPLPSYTYSLPESFTENLSTGFSTGPLGFFQINPSGTCGTGGTCNSPNFTQSGTVTVTFSFTEAVSGATATLTETGTYLAKYTGSNLWCSGKSSTQGVNYQSDCIDWGTTNSANQTDDRLVTFTNGDVLDVTFYNAQDWSIKPKIGFLEKISSHDTPIPLPGTLLLFAPGLGGLGLLHWRRKRKNSLETV